jgi:hypothetical protein
MRRSVGGTFSSCLGDQPGDVSVSLACRAALRIGAKGCVLCGALMTVPATESLRVDKRGAVHQRRSGIRWTALALFHPAGRMIQAGCGPESGHARRAMDHRSSWRRRAGSDILLTRHASRVTHCRRCRGWFALRRMGRQIFRWDRPSFLKAAALYLLFGVAANDRGRGHALSSTVPPLAY